MHPKAHHLALLLFIALLAFSLYRGIRYAAVDGANGSGYETGFTAGGLLWVAVLAGMLYLGLRLRARRSEG